MAKLKSDPIKKEDLIEYLSGQDDFRLEIAAFLSCKKRSIDVRHGGSYEDPITKKMRQYDIRAILTKGNCSVRLAIECKNLKDYFPLLISRLPRAETEAFHEVVHSHERDGDYITNPLGSNYRSIRVSNKHTIYEEDKFVGKSTAQIGRTLSGELSTGDAEIYEKWSQAVSSAFDLVSDSTEDYRKNEDRISLTVILPLLVLNDGVLWVADYSSEGSLISEPKQVEFCEVYLGKNLWTGPMGISYTFSHLHIFLITKFEDFLDHLVSDEDYWDLLFPIEAILKQIGMEDKE